MKRWVTKRTSEHWKKRIFKEYLNNYPNEELPKIKELSLNGKMPTFLIRQYFVCTFIPTFNDPYQIKICILFAYLECSISVLGN
jgi:hypothetical protein